MEVFKKIIKSVTLISDAKLDEIIVHFKPLTVKRNTLLLSAGEVCKKFYYMRSGCLRTYYVTDKGIEKTRLILLDHAPATALTSFISQEPSVEYIEALEDAELFVMTQADFFKLVNNMPEWALFYRYILERAFLFQNKKIEDLVTLSAKERYDKLLKETPHYINRLSNKILATYLDVSQETLSRLKSK
jgi:CRP-like cAMP-binding protein